MQRSCPDDWFTNWSSCRASPPGWAGHAAGSAGRLTRGPSLILQIETAEDVAQAVVRYRDPGFDFSDLTIATAGRPLGAFSLATFDKNAARIEGVTLLSA